MPLRLHLLGQPLLTRDDQPIELNTAKAIALLAMLALARTTQTRERVIGLLWGESTSDAARKNLRNTLWTIRKSLGDDVIEADGDRLALSADIWVDARELQRRETRDWRRESESRNLQSLVSLYRGPLLDGFVLADSSEFELWLTSERERFSQLYLRALGNLLDACRAQQDWREMIAVAQRALTEDNLQEPMYRALMEAHARLDTMMQMVREVASEE